MPYDYLCHLGDIAEFQWVKMRVIDFFARKKGICKVPFFIKLRRDRDSNPGYAFDVYTLSRRASSATRASLQVCCLSFAAAKVMLFSDVAKRFRKKVRKKVERKRIRASYDEILIEKSGGLANLLYLCAR